MKTIFGYLATVVFLVGLGGIAQAAGYQTGIDFCSEGPAYKGDYNESQIIIVPTKLRDVKGDSLYIEGMGTSSNDKGIETVVPVVYHPCDFSSEGFSKKELEQMRIIKIHDEISPAAGN